MAMTKAQIREKMSMMGRASWAARKKRLGLAALSEQFSRWAKKRHRKERLDKTPKRVYNKRDKGANTPYIPVGKLAEFLVKNGLTNGHRLREFLNRAKENRTRPSVKLSRKLILRANYMLTRWGFAPMYVTKSGKVSIVHQDQFGKWNFGARGGYRVTPGKSERIHQARPELSITPAAHTPGGTNVGTGEGEGNPGRIEGAQDNCNGQAALEHRRC